MLLINYLISLIFLVLSGLFSGLNLGLLSLSVHDLQRKAQLGDEYAKKVLPIRARGNQLLTTLLLGNVAVNAALSIFLADITTGVIGGLVSTVLIVVFGEIIPQSFVSRHALWVGAVTAPITKLYLFIFFPIAYPVGKILDKTLGEELPTVFSHEELKAIIREHEDNPDSELDIDEENIIIGALSYSTKTAEQLMTPRSVVYALEENRKLTPALFKEIKDKSFTRIPIYKEKMDNMIGILFVKDLIGIEESTEHIVLVRQLMRTDNFLHIIETMNLSELLNNFIDQHKHIACVFNEFGEFQGVITLEDVIEEIIQKEVFDENEPHLDPRLQAINKAKKIIAER